MASAIRLFGLALLALAAGLGSYDAVRSFSAGKPRMIKVGDVWSAIDQSSLLLLQPGVERHVEPYVGAWLWDPVMLSILTAPIWLAVGAIGLIFFLLGHGPESDDRWARR
jgi:hypothetical protein